MLRLAQIQSFRLLRQRVAGAAVTQTRLALPVVQVAVARSRVREPQSLPVARAQVGKVTAAAPVSGSLVVVVVGLVLLGRMATCVMSTAAVTAVQVCQAILAGRPFHMLAAVVGLVGLHRLLLVVLVVVVTAAMLLLATLNREARTRAAAVGVHTQGVRALAAPAL